MIEVRKKELKFRGKQLEELQKLDTREFANLITSRNKRFLLRNFQEAEEFMSRAKDKLSKNKPIRTHNRTLVILPQMVGMKIFIYNGKEFKPIEVTIDMLGHKLGEFSLTRTKTNHGKAGVGATKGSKHKSKK